MEHSDTEHVLMEGASDEERLCAEAAGAKQWKVVVQLLCEGVVPPDWVLERLFADMTAQLLTSFQVGKLQPAVVLPLITCAVRLGDNILVRNMLHTSFLSDEDKVDLLVLAVECSEIKIFLRLIYWSSKDVASQFFARQVANMDVAKHCWLLQCLDKCRLRYNQFNVLSDYIHFTLRTPHLRVLLDAVFGNGRDGADTAQTLRNVGCWGRLCDSLVYWPESNDMLVEVLAGLCRAERWWLHAPAVEELLAEKSSKKKRTMHFSLLEDIVKRAARRGDEEDLGLWWQKAGMMAAWCQRSSLNYLAFMLACALQDWEMLEQLLQGPFFCTLPLVCDLCDFLTYALHFGHVTVVACILRFYDVGECRLVGSNWYIIRQLADKCVEFGLVKWAVYLTIPDWRKVHSILESGHHPDAVNYALEIAVQNHQRFGGQHPDPDSAVRDDASDGGEGGSMSIFDSLLLKCTDPDGVARRVASTELRDALWSRLRKVVDRCMHPRTPRRVLKQAIKAREVDPIRDLVWRVDTSVLFNDTSIFGHFLKDPRSLRRERRKRQLMQILCQFVKVGASAADRASTHFVDSPLVTLLFTNSPLGHFLPDCTRLLLDSGAVSHRVLEGLRLLAKVNPDLRRRLSSEQEDPHWRRSYQTVLKAAATPCSLKHLARLAVSREVGGQPGRRARVRELEAPNDVKELVLFQDVTGPVEHRIIQNPNMYD